MHPGVSQSLSLDARAPSSGEKDMPAFVPLLCLGLRPTVLLTPLSNDRSLDSMQVSLSLDTEPVGTL